MKKGKVEGEGKEGRGLKKGGKRVNKAEHRVKKGKVEGRRTG